MRDRSWRQVLWQRVRWGSEAQIRQRLLGTRSDLTGPEIDCILKCLDEFEEPTYVEVGVLFGGTLVRMLKHLTEHKKIFHVIGIDLFEDLALENKSEAKQTHDVYNKWRILNVALRDDLDARLRQMGFTNFELIKGQSDQVLSQLDRRGDVFFIDGNHTYRQTKRDAEACLTRAQGGSYLVFHNASDTEQPDKQYVELDGGPKKACQDLVDADLVEYVGLFDRAAVVRVKSV